MSFSIPPACGKCSACQSTAIFRAPTPQKAAEIDDGGLHHPVAIDDDIDDAAQFLTGCALHRLAKKGFGRIPSATTAGVSVAVAAGGAAVPAWASTPFGEAAKKA